MGDLFLVDLHIHTWYSKDSLMNPRRIVKRALSLGLSMIAVTDHDCVRGAFEALEHGRRLGLDVLIGEEHSTDAGDIIGLRLQRQLTSHCWKDVITEIREQGGIAVLPHPYRGHSRIRELASAVDMVEVWNGRCTELQNSMAADLAMEMGKAACCGSDAHTYAELGKVAAEIDPASLVATRLVRRGRCRPRDVLLSQAIGAARRRDYCRLVQGAMRLLQQSLSRNAPIPGDDKLREESDESA